jgi:anaerobic magnesium-protoporphyrin IX monomethyl ester cyclase
VNILLLAPGFTIGERYNYKTKTKKGYLPPLGLGYLGAVLEDTGHQVHIADIPAQGYTDERIAFVANALQPDIIGFSLLTLAAPRAFELARYLKKHIQVPFIFGGPHASAFPQDCFQTGDERDIAVVGEGEITLLELLGKMAWNASLDDVQGICYQKNGKAVLNSPRPYIENLDTLPFPARHLFDMACYTPLANNYKRLPATNMITSRGCPYHCTFCFEGGKGGQHYRRLSSERAIEEIKQVVKTYGIKEISFWDDNFVITREWILDFCDRIWVEDLDISWSCFSRVDRVTPQILKAMAKAGCWNIFYGLEAGSQVLLNNIKKGTTVEQNRQAVAWTKEAGIEVRASFMLALPGETPELGKKTVDFAIEIDPDYVQFTPTTPMPGTKLYEDCARTGTLNPDFSQYTLWSVLFVPEGYKDAKEIVKLRLDAQRRFYLRPKYIWGRLKKIRGWQDLKRHIQGLLVILGMSK